MVGTSNLCSWNGHWLGPCCVERCCFFFSFYIPACNLLHSYGKWPSQKRVFPWIAFWIFPVRYLKVSQGVNLHFPMVFPWFSYDFPTQTSVSWLWFPRKKIVGPPTFFLEPIKLYSKRKLKKKWGADQFFITVGGLRKKFADLFLENHL